MAVIGYAIDEHQYRKLREVERGLHGDGRVLTSDQRRDLASLLSLILGELLPLTDEGRGVQFAVVSPCPASPSGRGEFIGDE